MKLPALIKWTGNKRKLANEILQYLPKYIETFYEPFCGSCAVSLALAASNYEVEHIKCSDLNEDLILLWNMLKSQPELLNYEQMYREYNRHANDDWTLSEPHRKTYYYSIRQSLNSNILPDIERANCLFFLLHTAYNGMIRYGKNGLNMPCAFRQSAEHPDSIKNKLDYYQPLLQKIEFVQRNYDCIAPGQNGYVFMDPPYLDTTGLYQCNFDHAAFFDWLKNLQCQWSMTYNSDKMPTTYHHIIAEQLECNWMPLRALQSQFNKLGKHKNQTSVAEILFLKHN